MSLHYHVVFSTKDRQPFIEPAWREDLHRYLGGCIKTLGGIPEEIGGIEDHVHLLLGLRATHCLADVLRDIKTASSKWAHEERHLPRFGWQDGYGAFTVSRSNIDSVRSYIATQEEHHRKHPFQSEYLALLKKHHVEFDERFLW
ncbi:MAG: IS200/IS605 family transposase [Acidobacteriota bacterium]